MVENIDTIKMSTANTTRLDNVLTSWSPLHLNVVVVFVVVGGGGDDSHERHFQEM